MSGGKAARVPRGITLLPHVAMSNSTRFHAPISTTWHRGEWLMKRIAPSSVVVSSDFVPVVDLQSEPIRGLFSPSAGACFRGLLHGCQQSLARLVIARRGCQA